MSSPEVERFEITDQDLADEFNPYRRTFRQSKNQATYGIWADSDEDEQPSFGGGGKRTKDYAAPVNFISGGVKVGDKVTKEDADDDNDEMDSDSDGEFDRARFPSNFINKDSNRMKGSRPKFPGGRSSGQSGSNIGDWETHTKGIGKKLLEKMGHVAGRGLGKNLQGISTPVEAKLRKGKGTIGFYGSERTKRSLEDFPVYDSEEEENQEFQSQLSQWKRQPEGGKKKLKYLYRTAEEVIATGGKKKVKDTSKMSKVKVIDMTGKEQKVLSGYHAIASRHDMPLVEEEEEVQAQGKRVFDMPELLHNLNILVDMAEEEIIANDRRLKYERDMVVNLTYEKEKLTTVCEQEEQQLTRLNAVMSIISCCEERMKPGSDNPMDLDECALIFKKLQEQYYEEYQMYELGTLAIAVVVPLVKSYFEKWNPLKFPAYGQSVMKEWKQLLQDATHSYQVSQPTMDPYERLIWDVWMPHVRSSITNVWSPRDCDALIELLEAWVPVLPTWILQNVLDQLVLPRLQQEVENWNPLTDTMPIHAWLHPWLPLMGDKLLPLYGPIRHKMANALTNWHPSDPSAKMILQPWLNVFPQGHMDAFIVKNIVPKLALCLQEFIINPHQQHLDAWNWVMAWRDMVPLSSFISLLEKNFFPKWLQVLCSWLSNHPNYDEVTKWYTGWKSQFPEPLINTTVVKDQFHKALDIMNRAVSGHFQPGAKENVAYLTHHERTGSLGMPAQTQGSVPSFPAPAMRSHTALTATPTSFKELIEKKAEENNLLFLPIPNKTYEAKQVYKFGKVQIYIDRSVVFLQDNPQSMWKPVSIGQLIERAR